MIVLEPGANRGSPHNGKNFLFVGVVRNPSLFAPVDKRFELNHSDGSSALSIEARQVTERVALAKIEARADTKNISLKVRIVPMRSGGIRTFLPRACKTLLGLQLVDSMSFKLLNIEAASMMAPAIADRC